MPTTLEDLYNLALAAIDGAFGWLPETLSLLLIVLIVSFLTKTLTKRLHFHFEKQKKIWHDCFVRAVYKPLNYYIWFFTVVHILDLLLYRVVEFASIENMHTLLGVGAVASLGWFLMRWKKNIVAQITKKSKNREIALDITKIDVIDKILTLVIFFTSGLLILEVTDRSMNTILAFGGVGGLAIAFASQEIISNFFAGLMIYITHPFAKGDWINVPEKNIEGIVEEIGWYMILIKGMDKRPLYVPNSVFSKAMIINPSRMTHRQFKEIVGLRYDDMQVMKTIMQEIRTMLHHHPNIDRSQTITVQFTNLGEYSLDILISAFSQLVDSPSYLELKGDLLFKIAEIVAKHKAEIAFPTKNIVTLEKK